MMITHPLQNWIEVPKTIFYASVYYKHNIVSRLIGLSRDSKGNVARQTAMEFKEGVFL